MTEQHVEAPVSVEEIMEVKRALAASQATIMHLVQAKLELEKKVGLIVVGSHPCNCKLMFLTAETGEVQG